MEVCFRASIRILFIVFSNFFVIHSYASEATDLYYEQGGYNQSRESVSTGEVDKVDPFTGGLQLSHIDAVVPGEGQTTVSIRRIYRSLAKPSSNGNFKGERTPVGIGWQMHFGRVITPLNQPSCNNSQGDLLAGKNSVFEAQNGSKEELLPAITATFGGHQMVSKSKWVADCITNAPSGYLIRSPDGMRYYADHRVSNQNGFDYHYVTRIVDLFGNYITITYGAADGATTGDGSVAQPYDIATTNAKNYFNLIKQIKNYSASGSLINTVDFYYKDINSVHARIDNIKVNGTTFVNYEYTAVNVNEVVKPYYFLTAAKVDNATTGDATWDYSYYTTGTNGLYCLNYYETPGNARITYTYKAENFRITAGVEWPTIVVDKRAIGTNGGVQTSGTWTYTYDQNSTRDQTTILLPTNEKIIYDHVGADNYASSEIWKVGTLLKKQYVSSTGSIIKQEDYVFSLGTKLSTQNEFHLYKAVSGNADTYSARLTSHSISQDGTTYTTTYSNFDSFDNAQTIVETGNDSKTTTRTFYNETANWIIGKQEDSTVAGAEGGTIDRNYKSGGLGLLDYESVFGAKTSYTYFANGDLKSVDGPRTDVSDVVNYSSYVLGVPRTETYTGGITIARTVDSKKGDVLSETDQRGRVRSFTYDRDHSTLSMSTPRTDDENLVIGTSYSSSGITKTVTRGDYVVTQNLDGLGREKTNTKSGSGLASLLVSSTYNALGQKTFESDPYYSGASYKGRNFTYDALGRVKTIEYTADTTKITYDYLSGNRVQIKKLIDAVVKSDETLTYRSYGNPDEKQITKIEKVTGTGTTTTTIARDKFGNITSVAQDGKTRTFVLDSYKHIDYILDPETGTTDLVVDAAGNTTSKQVGASGTTTFIYDVFNRIDYINYPGTTADVDYEYYADGSLKAVSTLNGSSTITKRSFDYDANGNMSYEDLSIDGKTFRIDYGYSIKDALSTVTYPVGNGTRYSISYNPDSFGRPKTVGNLVSGINFHANGNLSQYLYSNGQAFNSTQDSRLFVDRMQSSKNGIYSMDLDYGVNGIGNITSISGISQPVGITLDYDLASRLTHINGTKQISYDLRGNISSKNVGGKNLVYNYDTTSDRLTSVTGDVNWPFQYDVYGNTTFNGTDAFIYNDANQLASVNTNQKLFTYDGLDRRAREISNGLTRYTMYGQNERIMFEYIPGVLEQNYVYLQGKLVAKRDDCTTFDSDGDQMPDCYEFQYGFDAHDPSDALLDSDHDGLNNLAEYNLGTHPISSDTDSDGIEDGTEYVYGLNPRSNDSSSDLDGDGWNNAMEIANGTHIFKQDTDGDGIIDSLDPRPLFNRAIIPVINYPLSDSGQ